MPPKRKQTPLDDEDSLSEEVEDVSEDFIRVKRPRTESVETVVQDSWIDKYSPLNSSEICVNPRKLKELREVLEPMIRGTSECRLLVVTGPAGCGKSTLIKCLGNELVAKVKEASSGKTEPNKSQEGGFPNIVEYFDSELQDVSHIRHFSEFLDASRYRIGSNLALIVVEEYPNVFHHETLQSFRDCIRNWLYSPGTLPPLVLCLTEIEIESESGHRGYYNIENNFTAETLLGRALMTHGVSSGVVQRVKFLPIAKTFMKKSISKVIQKERVKIPPEKQVSFLSSLYESGDIRASLSNLQLWARTGSFDSDLSGKENQISLFHAVGKVVHSSAKFASMDEESSDSFSIRAVLDGYNNFGLLHLALLENYQIYSGSQYEVAVAADLVDALSISDTLGGLEESHEYAIREVRHQLRNVGESRGRTQPMKFPRHFKMLKAANKVKREVDNYSRYIGDSRVSFANVNLLDGYFVPSIFNSFRYKLQNGSKPYSYNRVGGKFQQIFADDEVPVMESEFEHESGVKDQFAMEIEAKMGGSEDRNDGLSEDDLSDEIHNTTDDDNDNDDFNDSLDDKLVSLTQRHDEDELSDDPELDWLVSQGRL